MNERIKYLRKLLGLSQADFAYKIGVNASTIYGWEHDVKIPEAKLNEICRAFKINKNWLITGKGDPDTPNDKDVYLETSSDRLRFMRKKRGWTQKQLAARLGVTDVSISLWEKDASNIQPAKKQLLCNLLGCNVEWFDTGLGEASVESDKSSIHFETAREFAVRNGCDEVTSLVFERFMELPESEKKAFGNFISQLLTQKVRDAADKGVGTSSLEDSQNIYRDVYTINNTTFNQNNYND